jgi:hypothetical protein
MIISPIQEIPSNLSQLIATTAPKGDKSSKLPQNLSCHSTLRTVLQFQSRPALLFKQKDDNILQIK